MSDSEEEYGPIDTSWGMKSLKVEEAGWDSLIDPNFKPGPNNLGAGNLHRRGKNFKPIGEDLILAQRLKKPIGKNKMEEAIRETEVNLGLPKSSSKGERKKKKPVDSGSPRKSSHKSPATISKSKENVNVPSTTRIPAISTDSGGGSNWLQSSLVDIPFWKSKESTDTLPTPTTTPKPVPTPTTVQAPAPVMAAHISTQTIPRPNFTSPKNDHNRVFTSGILAKQKVESVWAKRTNQLQEDEGWGAVAKDVEPFINSGWENKADVEEEITTNNIKDWGNSSWGKEPIDTTAGWGKFAEEEPIHHNHNHNAIPSTRPSWLNTIPTRDNSQPIQQQHHQPHQQQQSSRFSNPSKQRYSDNAPIDLPKPTNYRLDQSIMTLNTAPPPPPENKILITINVELSDDIKVAVDIRELDEPLQLAKTFGKDNNIQSENIINALTKLFTAQKETAIRKSQFKLQKRVFSSQSNTRYSPQSNVYTKSHFQQQYQKQHQQQQYVNPQTSPPPFTRKAYY